jgi:hypothetical protein
VGLREPIPVVHAGTINEQMRPSITGILGALLGLAPTLGLGLPVLWTSADSETPAWPFWILLTFAVTYVIALVAAIAPTRLRATTWLLVILLTQGGSFLLGVFSVRGSATTFFIPVASGDSHAMDRDDSQIQAA